ncbi:hypothetical protein [Frankia sp. Cr2]|uniref:hypothetical protein n=1 Tax=Frankia sp. Cr2 TaxID=3073932 RepID=UPI002AD5495B|nr:hypothetical protein [Frankia sp. Cr2]
MAAALLDAVDYDPPSARSTDVTAVVRAAINEVNPATFTVQADLLEELVQAASQASTEWDKGEEADPRSGTHLAMQSGTQHHRFSECAAANNDTNLRREQSAYLRKIQDDTFTTVAATFSVTAGPLLGEKSWVLTPGGVINDDPFGIPGNDRHDEPTDRFSISFRKMKKHCPLRNKKQT